MRLPCTLIWIVACSISHAQPTAVVLPSEPDYEAEKLQFQRGSLLYYNLHGNSDDWSAAALQAAADEGDVQAQVRLGILSEQGRGLPQDYAAARSWYEKAAPQSADAQFLLGMMLYQGKGIPVDFDAARRHFEQAAGQGSLQAQVNLGWMCEYGQGQADAVPDLACARRWYERAASAGDPMGMFNLGTQYYLGKGVTQDYAEARHWFVRAAGKDFAGAYYNLGVMALGQGQARDPVQAYEWFKLAELAAYPGAAYNIGKVVGELQDTQRSEAEEWVRRWRTAH